jgi:hypothetical protein
MRSEKAANGSRTRDLKLGKLALYQLSYRRAYFRAPRAPPLWSPVLPRQGYRSL